MPVLPCTQYDKLAFSLHLHDLFIYHFDPMRQKWSGYSFNRYCFQLIINSKSSFYELFFCSSDIQISKNVIYIDINVDLNKDHRRFSIFYPSIDQQWISSFEMLLLTWDAHFYRGEDLWPSIYSSRVIRPHSYDALLHLYY